MWIPPGSSDEWEKHPWSQSRILELSDDEGGRYQAFWDWVESRIPDEPLWLLDSIAVDPHIQGKGYGRALIELGQSMAASTDCGAILSTGTERNILIYKKCGFHIMDHVDSPNGGPHIWYMRWDPERGSDAPDQPDVPRGAPYAGPYPALRQGRCSPTDSRGHRNGGRPVI